MSRATDPRVPVEELLALMRDLFAAVGLAETDAAEVAEALVQADQEGQPSHGVMMADLYVRRIVAGSVDPRSSGSVIQGHGATAVIDAENGVGQIVARRAMDLACERALEHGVGIVAVRNGFHYGTGSRYTERAARAGLIGVAMSNTRPLMPSPGGAERLVGNNPIAIAVPTASGDAISFDMATSQAAMGKIRHAAASGTTIPSDWATNAAGEPTTDPKEAIAGMLLPAGGGKGFGLALMIDLLAGLLSQGGLGPSVTPLFGDNSVPYNCSQLFLAINPTFFGATDLAERAQGVADRIHGSARAGSASGMARVPGDVRREARHRNTREVPVSRPVLASLLQLAQSRGVSTDHLQPLLNSAAHPPQQQASAPS